MFYVNIHSTVVEVTFQVSMYDQSFLVSSCSIWCVLNMSGLKVCVPSFSPKVQALTRGKLDAILTSLYDIPCPFFFLIFILFSSLSQHSCLQLSSLIPSTHLLTAPKSIDHLLILFMSFFQASSLTLAKST